MATLFVTILCGLCVTVLAFRWLKNRLTNPLWELPSPKAHPFVGHTFKVDGLALHRQYAQWAKEYGPAFRLQIGAAQGVVFSDFDTIYQVLVKDGKSFGGRQSKPRLDTFFEGTGILFSVKPDNTWQALRKASHQHLRQFGDGMARLETVINEVSEDMFKEFENSKGKAYDPYQIVFNTALSTIAFLITGDCIPKGHKIVESMRLFESRGPLLFISPRLQYVVYDFFPSLKYLGLSGWKEIQEVLASQQSLWDDILKHSEENPHLESFVSALMHSVKNDSNSLFTERDVQKTISSLLLAGVTTTSGTFYAIINILSHYQNIQEDLFNEVQKVAGTSRISLMHRTNMPRFQAFLLEVNRYVSLVALSVPHQTVKTSKVQGYTIPSGSVVIANLWALHHDESLWDQPYELKPERFLDEQGQVVPVDHPNRRHLMPFGAGTRVCLGESLAMARLFLWTATFLQNYRVRPAKGNEKSSCDPRNFPYQGVLRVAPYKVHMEQR